ncbi:hypothetical protein Cni_G20434 [Canna indica]|uniref:Uncharacterized protein n=1 Tax=Canna indica TaxID=4628 RepID=A0AAQ3QKS1_9LILI|nr:hypothetical protein Cni_G20434 [Canna indica]
MLSNLIRCHNQFSSSLPYSPDSAQLLRLDLKHNQLAGPVPSLPPTLHYLTLSSNTLTGRVDSMLPRTWRSRWWTLATTGSGGHPAIAGFDQSLVPQQQPILRRGAEPPSSRVQQRNAATLPAAQLLDGGGEGREEEEEAARGGGNKEEEEC